MEEFKNYDTAAASYYATADRKMMPLLSWDFHMDNYNAMISFKDDLIALKELGRNWDLTIDFTKELTVEKTVIVVTSPKLEIVYATHNIEQMNGYSPKEVVGRSPKMFQGKHTCPVISKKIRKAVTEKQPFEEVILNYRKDKSVYKCKIKGVPVFDKKGNLTNYIAFEHIAA